MKKLQDKVIIVTGASSGLGAASAIRIAAEGAKVVLAARRRDRGEEMIRQIKAEGGEGLFVQTDVTRTADVKALVSAAIDRFGGLDGAFNNAGVTGPTMTPLADVEEDGWDEAINTNLRAVFVCMKYQIPALLARGGGAIVNMSSMYGLKPSDLGHAAYCASKAAVDALSHSMRVDLLRHNIKVTAIHPGAVETEFGIVRFKGDKAMADKAYDGLKPLTGEDIAGIILYCCDLPEHVCINDLVVTPVRQADAIYFYRS